MKDKETLDRLFDDAFEAAVEDSFKGVEVPDPSASWARLAPRLAMEARRRARRRRLQMVSLAIASLLIGGFIFGKPQETEAFKPIAKFFTGLKGDVVTLVIGDKKSLEDTQGALTAPPPDGVGPVMGDDSGIDRAVAGRYVGKSMEEIRKHTTSSLPQVNLPEGYEISYIELTTNKENKFLICTFIYQALHNADTLQLTIVPVTLKSKLYPHLTHEENIVKELKVNGLEAVKVKEGDMYRLIWSDTSNTYLLRAGLSDEKLVQLAEQIN